MDSSSQIQKSTEGVWETPSPKLIARRVSTARVVTDNSAGLKLAIDSQCKSGMELDNNSEDTVMDNNNDKKAYSSLGGTEGEK